MNFCVDDDTCIPFLIINNVIGQVGQLGHLRLGATFLHAQLKSWDASYSYGLGRRLISIIDLYRKIGVG